MTEFEMAYYAINAWKETDRKIKIKLKKSKKEVKQVELMKFRKEVIKHSIDEYKEIA